MIQATATQPALVGDTDATDRVDDMPLTAAMVVLALVLPAAARRVVPRVEVASRVGRDAR